MRRQEPIPDALPGHPGPDPGSIMAGLPGFPIRDFGNDNMRHTYAGDKFPPAFFRKDGVPYGAREIVSGNHSSRNTTHMRQDRGYLEKKAAPAPEGSGQRPVQKRLRGINWSLGALS
jgi:hypothetical protein